MAASQHPGFGAAVLYDKVNHVNEDFFVYSADPEVPFYHHSSKKPWPGYLALFDQTRDEIVLDCRDAFAYSACYEQSKCLVAVQAPCSATKGNAKSPWLIFPVDLQKTRVGSSPFQVAPHEHQDLCWEEPSQLKTLCSNLRPYQGLQVRLKLVWQGSLPLVSCEGAVLTWTEAQVRSAQASALTGAATEKLVWALTGRTPPFDDPVGPHREELSKVLIHKNGKCYCSPTLTFSKDPSLSVTLYAKADFIEGPLEVGDDVCGDLYREWLQVGSPLSFVIRNLRKREAPASDLELELVTGQDSSSRTWTKLLDVSAAHWDQEWKLEHGKTDKTQKYYRFLSCRRAGAIEVCDDEDFFDVRVALEKQLRRMANDSVDKVKYEIIAEQNTKEKLLQTSSREAAADGEDSKKRAYIEACQKLNVLCKPSSVEKDAAKKFKSSSYTENAPSSRSRHNHNKKHWEQHRGQPQWSRRSSCDVLDHGPEKKVHLYGIQDARYRPLVTLRNLLESGGVVWENSSSQAFNDSVLHVCECVALVNSDASYVERIKETLKYWNFESLSQWGISDSSIQGFSREDVQWVFRDFCPAPVWYGFAGTFVRPQLSDIDLAFSLHCYMECQCHPDMATMKACVQAFPRGYSNQRPKDYMGFPVFLVHHSDFERCSSQSVEVCDQLYAQLKKGLLEEIEIWIEANAGANPFWEVGPLYRACLWLSQLPAAGIHPGTYEEKLARLAMVSEGYKAEASKFARVFEDRRGVREQRMDLSKICSFKFPGMAPCYDAEWLRFPASLP